MFDWLGSAIGWVQGWLFEQLLLPLLFSTGLVNYADQAYDGLEWTVIGMIELSLMAVILPRLERRFAVEPLLDRPGVRTDIFYTFLHRLGAFPLIAFAVLSPGFDALEAQLRLHGFTRWAPDQLWPGVTDLPLVSFALYLVLLDFVDYWVHRGQHRLGWWWALHSVHHSQRQMTFWSDDRNHVFDDLLRGAIMAAVALLMGVAPEQFMLLTVCSRVLQSVQHGNLRWRWGAAGECLLVSPSYHRLHHAIGYGHEGAARGCNFAVLFPVWDLLFRTADFRPGFVPTGITDQLQGRDYGRGFMAQQWLALRRLIRRR